MSIALMTGSFNPWYDGHEDIVVKALEIFSKVIILQANNPDKKISDISWSKLQNEIKWFGKNVKGGESRIQLVQWDGLIVDYIKDHNINTPISGQWNPPVISAIIRGLRNSHDFQYEMNQQYWNEDLGLKIPIVYFITNRNLQHISSSAIRLIEKFKNLDL